MHIFRRDILKWTSLGLVGGASALLLPPGARAYSAPRPPSDCVFNVRAYGAVGDGKTVDTPAVNRAIHAAAAAGGGTVLFPAGTYLCYSIKLKSCIALYLDEGAVILAAGTPREGMQPNGYDVAEANGPWEIYQDFGHNHWHNSLIWGEGLHDLAILGPGRIWGKGLSSGRADDLETPLAEKPGVGNKAIALKNCCNVILRDFSILAGGHFAILVTAVDNMTIDNLRIDTNRDGMDIDCCRNVRITNCSVNSPWDDGICPKSSFALGYPRASENITISGCHLTGHYQVGTMLDGSCKPFAPEFYRTAMHHTDRIKCGTESIGGFKNIAISNCVFDNSSGLALETVDGAPLEYITFTGVTMRNIRNAPFFLRLGARMRSPKGTPIGTLRRVLISNVVCYGPENDMPSIISGVPGHDIEDLKFSDIYVLNQGGGSKETAGATPPEKEDEYPEPTRFGPMPAAGFFMRHVRNAEFNHVEIANAKADARPAFWMQDVKDVDFFRLTLSGKRGGPAFLLHDVSSFRVSGSRAVADQSLSAVNNREI